MSNYVKTTDFAAKDALVSGNPAKVVKGTEIGAEFDAISVAVETKADLISPALTGIPKSPTAAVGTNTTQIATTAFVATAIAAAYPVGSIYINATNSTNPATLLGFGTWTAFGAGRVLVGFDSGNTLFDSAEETGGSYDSIVVSHTHTGTTNSDGAHTHQILRNATPTNGVDTTGIAANSYDGNNNGPVTTTSSGVHTHAFTTGSTGSSATNANIQPYITVYMWKRTA